jgi:hypothetical protein
MAFGVIDIYPIVFIGTLSLQIIEETIMRAG